MARRHGAAARERERGSVLSVAASAATTAAARYCRRQLWRRAGMPLRNRLAHCAHGGPGSAPPVDNRTGRYRRPDAQSTDRRRLTCLLAHRAHLTSTINLPHDTHMFFRQTFLSSFLSPPLKLSAVPCFSLSSLSHCRTSLSHRYCFLTRAIVCLNSIRILIGRSFLCC